MLFLIWDWIMNTISQRNLKKYFQIDVPYNIYKFKKVVRPQYLQGVAPLYSFTTVENGIISRKWILGNEVHIKYRVVSL